MLILLEGPDCTGKTTLANDIATQHYPDATVLKRGPLRQDPLLEYLVPLSQHDPENDRWILDRWHVGELIYGPLLRGESQLTPAQAYYVELMLNTCGATRVHMTADQHVIEQCFHGRGDDIISVDMIPKIIAGYDEYAARWHLPSYHRVSTGDTTRFTLWTTPSIIVTDTRESYARGLVKSWYLGHGSPRVLLLGDQMGPHKETRPYVPLPFVPWRSTSGHWLFTALDAAEVRVDDIGLVNACDRSSKALYDLWMTAWQPPVVALGVNARNAAAEAGLPVALHLSHPQHARRFYQSTFKEYGLKIKELTT